MVAKSIGCAVMPHQVVAGTFPDRPDYMGEPDCGFPGKSLHNAPPWETQESGMGIMKHFH